MREKSGVVRLQVELAEEDAEALDILLHEAGYATRAEMTRAAFSLLSIIWELYKQGIPIDIPDPRQQGRIIRLVGIWPRLKRPETTT